MQIVKSRQGCLFSSSLEHHTKNCSGRCQTDYCLDQPEFTVKDQKFFQTKTFDVVKDFQCSLCDTYTTTYDAYIQHLNGKGHAKNIMLGELPKNTLNLYVCTECGVGVYGTLALAEHERSHNEASVFSCKACLRSFTSKNALESHNDSLSHKTKIQSHH